MGRSRGNFHNYEDPTQRTRKKKNVASVENFESASTVQGTDGGGKYNCDYCQKDITGKVRIKCAMCPDFDLCVECMSVGAEISPHKSIHPYRVMGNLSFPLICPDWSADDEMLLLEGLEIYGMGNWAEVAEHVGTKSKEQCVEHYKNIYLNSLCFPLPDMSHVAGKNRKELQAMAKGHVEEKKSTSLPGEPHMKEEFPFSPHRIKLEEMNKGESSGLLPSGIDMDSQTDRSYGGKKPISSGNKASTLVELSGYNAKRQEFDPEYDNDAEQLLAEMEFKETDTPEEHELKLRVLRIYSKRLDERKRRKEFILERDLLYPNPFEKDLSAEERALCRRYDVFMRFHSKEEHDELLRTVVNEHRMLKRLKDLKDAQAAGCRNSSEAERYLEKKRRRETEESSQKAKEIGQYGPNGLAIGNDSNSRPSGPASSGYVNDLDLIGFSESQLLSESEKRLCRETKLVPPVYLHMQQVMSEEIFKGNVSNKMDAHHLFKIDPSKIDRVYDMLVKKGIAQP